MNNGLIANSKDWWENEFKTQWVYGSIDGRLQTTYYVSLVLLILHQKYLEEMQKAASILDFGCALGEATNVLSSINSNVVGYDFSNEATRMARVNFPHLTFKNEIGPYDNFDIIYCSNVLEHFKNPIEQTIKLSKICNKYIIILVPYEQEPNYFHFYRFNFNEFENKIPNFKLVYKMVAQTTNVVLDGGRQILYVLEKENFTNK